MWLFSFYVNHREGTQDVFTPDGLDLQFMFMSLLHCLHVIKFHISIFIIWYLCSHFKNDQDLTTNLLPSPSEQESGRLSRRKAFKMKPTMKDSMVLMQDMLEEHASQGGGRRGGGKGATLQRRAGSTSMKSPSTKQPRHLTARIVAMGDDRVLGRLAKAYYAFRWGPGHFIRCKNQTVETLWQQLEGEALLRDLRFTWLSCMERGGGA